MHVIKNKIGIGVHKIIYCSEQLSLLHHRIFKVIHWDGRSNGLLLMFDSWLLKLIHACTSLVPWKWPNIITGQGVPMISYKMVNDCYKDTP